MKTATVQVISVQNPFKVGDGVTVHRYSDANAFTVIKVTAKTITIQRDKATLLNGANSNEADKMTFTPGGFCGHFEGAQRYSYERDLNGSIITARLQKKPYMRWTAGAGEEYAPGVRGYGNVPEPSFKTPAKETVTPGRREHYDFNF